MHTQFLSLPHELIIQVLCELPPSSIVTCQLVNRRLNTLIRNSVVLQYAITLDSEAAEDSPCSNLSINSKVKQLKSSQAAWATLRPDFVTSQAVAHRSDVYDLSAGVYVLSGDLSHTLLYSSDLPTRQEDEMKWKGISSDKVIIDIGLCLFEHDLIALVTTSPHDVPPGTLPSFDIEIELRKFSTDEPHPLAERRTLYVMNSQLEKPAVGIEIVGQHLVLVLSFPTASRPSDRIFIFEWKNTLKASFEVNHGNYANLLFLSDELILLPNNKSGTLDVFRIPTISTLEALTPLLRLSLPTLSQGLAYGGISCRAEPNPISQSSIPEMRRRASAKENGHRQRAWTAIADDALCLFSLSVWIAQLIMTQDHGWAVDIRGIHRLSFVVHRSALLKVVSAFESAKAEHETLERAKREDISEGMKRENGVLEPDELARPSAPNAPTASAHQTLSLIDRIPWHEWGLYKTRWFNMDNFTTQWITTTAGQRLVRMHKTRPMDPDDKTPFEVLDFNPQRSQKAAQWMDGQLQNGILPQLARVGGAREYFVVLSRDTQISEHGADEYGGTGMSSFSGDNHKTINANNDIDDAEEDTNAGSVRPLDADNNDPVSPTADIQETSNTILTPIQTEPVPSTSNDNLEDHEDRDESDTWPRLGPVLDWSAAPPGVVLWAPGGEAFEPANVFAEPLINGLPFIERVSRSRYRYDGVMLDEERVIGTRLNFETRCLEEIEVHHFG